MTNAPKLNTVCASCGYADPLHHVDPHKARNSLLLHSHYTGRCPITGKPVDPEGYRS